MRNKHWSLGIVLLVLMFMCVGCAPAQNAAPAVETPAATEAPASMAEPTVPAAAEAPTGKPTDQADDYYDVDASNVKDMDKAEREKYLKEANTYKESDASLRDFYGTDPVPEGMPQPVEAQDAVKTGAEKSCTLLIECSSIFNYMDQFNTDKMEVLPEDGVIYAARQVVFYEGENVFDVLLREVQNNRIHMEYESVPGYNSSYIEGINNIYEYDCGELSGWMYSVNGWFPNYGPSRYQLQDGDTVEWHYTCDLGRDFGVTWQRPS